MPETQQFNRRAFLSIAGVTGVTLALAACSPGATTAGKLAGTSLAIMPSAAPTNWKAVLAKANTALKKEHGFVLDAQFINWGNYLQQALLKFTAGATFDTALEALWANMAQLQQSGSLVDLTKELGKWPNLSKQLAPQLIEANKWNGHIWGVPQVNSAGRVQHFAIRQDLAKQYGFSDIQDYDTLEKYFYAVKQKSGGMTPFGLSSNLTWQLVVPTPTGLFNQHSWENPNTIQNSFAGSGLQFLFDKNAAKTGSSKPIPFWEDEGVIAALKKVRQYYNDGIVNADGLNTDNANIGTQFQAGKYASVWAITDGSTSNALPGLRKNVPTADMADILPFGGDLTSVKPHQTFQADNMVVINANGGDVDRALALQDWLSVKENHDLVEYGIEGTDWEPVGENSYKQLSDYAFPGYSLLWRSSLERRSQYMSASETKVFDWALKYENFTADTFGSFIPNTTPVKQAAASMNNVITQYANPLFYGVVDVQTGLDQLKKAADGAGLSVLQAEMEKQGDAYLKARKA
jgi:putative aldouronate transport system substrate-binding protein